MYTTVPYFDGENELAKIIHDYGHIEYYIIDKNVVGCRLLHRADGPAVESRSSTEWYYRGMLHREDGPAIIVKQDCSEYFWVFGENYKSLPSPEEIKIIKKEMIIRGVIL